MKNIRIAIADDMFLYTEGLSLLLKDLHYNIVLKTTTVKGLCDGLCNSSVACDICMISMNLLKKEGFAMLTELKVKFPLVKVLGYSFFNENSLDESDLQGVDAILVSYNKPEDLENMIQRLYTGRLE